MSLLGLGEYDSPAASNQDDSPAPAEQSTAEASASGSAIRLSIVDYENDVDEKEEDVAAVRRVMGSGLDDDAVRNAQPRRVGVGGVQISVVKKPMGAAPAASAGSTSADADAEAGGPSDRGEDAQIPASQLEKFMSLVETTKSGYSVNDHIRNAKSFRNPDILEKLVAFFDVRECGTNYDRFYLCRSPSALYDPSDLSKDEHYEKLEELRRKMVERQSRKQGAPVSFTSGGTVQGNAGPDVTASRQRKSKWGEGSADDPAAKRVS